FQMWEISWIGIPCAIVGIAYFLLLGRWLLPDRRPAINLSDDPRQYMVEMSVEPGGPLVNKTIEEAGLRHLPGLYLAEIDRDGEILPAVGPRERLQANDRLVFVGVVESVVDLRKMRGLRPAHDQLMKLNSPVTSRSLIEAVVSNRCPIVNKSIREGQFRSRYQAAVLAVARSGHRLTGKIGDIVLQPGDTLLLEAHADFAKQQRNSNDFFLVSSVDNASLPRHEQAWTALAVLVAMIGVVTALDWDMLTAALVAAIAMIVTRCCTSEEARRSIDWSVLITIGAASGIARSLETTGLAKFVTEQLITLAGEHPWTQLIVVYALTMVLTELITNNAAAQLMFPLAMSTVDQVGVSHVPFVVAIMVAASMGFATPFGYQTNLMVYGPGGYKFSDYLRVGVPLDLLMMLVTILLTPWLYPF
ncbi:MAG: SLC13 family permease, partial [Planctomycetaceae bacterium]